MSDYVENSLETNTAIINELKELGLELKEQEKQSDNVYYQAGLEVAKQLVVKRLKRIASALIHDSADKWVNKD